MRIIIQKARGGPDVLKPQEAPKPQAAEGEVLVRVSHAGINPVDVSVRTGFYNFLGEPPFTVGWDISGTVEAVGKGVSALKPGDEVFGMPRFPKQAAAYAEYVTSPAHELALRPKSLGFAEAGALPLAGLTAWQALVDAGQIKAGQKILVQAAAGGVGHIAVQIAKARGAYVVATTSAGKLNYVKSIGADEVIDYAKQDFTKLPPEFDAVLDTISGEHAEQSLKVLRHGGHLLCLRDASAAALEQAKSETKSLHRIGVRPDGRALAELAKLVELGSLKIHVAKSFPLEQAGAAHEFLGTHPIGKVTLAITQP